jgi:hypothetical protein
MPWKKKSRRSKPNPPPPSREPKSRDQRVAHDAARGGKNFRDRDNRGWTTLEIFSGRRVLRRSQFADRIAHILERLSNCYRPDGLERNRYRKAATHYGNFFSVWRKTQSSQ